MTEDSSAQRYRPKMPAGDWGVIAPYVHDVVRRAEPIVTYSARELYPAVSRLVLFAHTSRMPLRDEVVFDPFTIERFVHFHLDAYNRASRNSMRARVRRVSEAFLGDVAAIRIRALGKAEASRPYTAREIALLDGWAQAQLSTERATSARALLALGLGAGLTGSEIIAAQAEDVSKGPSGTLITVHAVQQRTVPLLPQWAEELTARTRFLNGHGWLFRSEQRGGNVNLLNDFVARTGPEVPLQARRMRATWLAEHLEQGTPVKLLLRIAGLQSAEALDRVLPFVQG